VAVKLSEFINVFVELPRDLSVKKSAIENKQDLIRIRREIRIMSLLKHPNIIEIYEVFENKDKIILVMEFASGGGE
jgi:serine/threonine protein kinase